VLAISGGALGIVLAMWLLDLLTATGNLDIPRLQEVQLDSGVLLFSCGLTMLAGVLFGVLPAWRIASSDPQEALRDGSRSVTEGRSGMRLRQGLIGVEVGVSTALLIVAGLLASSLTHLLRVDKGFDAEQVLTVDVRLAGNLYAPEAARERFFERLLAQAANIPRVQAAGFVTALPTRGETFIDPIFLAGDTRPPMERPLVNNRYASPSYFGVMNIPIRNGRAFEESDRGRGVAVLSEKAAKLLWPGDPNPVGKTFIGEDDKPRTLVGVVADVRASLQRDPPPTAYYPFWQRVPGSGYLVVRTSSDKGAAAAAIRAVLRRQDPQLPISSIRTMEEMIDLSVSERRFQLTLVVAFAASALLVASLGIYGVVAYSVARRRNELGVRMALGAQRSQLLGLVIRQGMAPVVVGLVAGAVAAMFLGGAIRGLLFGVQPVDPLTIAVVATTLLIVGGLACFIPSWRSIDNDAVTSLRFE
jgi:predicted permease